MARSVYGRAYIPAWRDYGIVRKIARDRRVGWLWGRQTNRSNIMSIALSVVLML